MANSIFSFDAPDDPNASYDMQLLQLQRRQRMADLLQRDAMEPIQSASPGATVSWSQGLAKALKGYYAGSDQRGLDKRYAQLGQTDRTAAQALIDHLSPTKPLASTPATMSAGPNLPDNSLPGLPASEAPTNAEQMSAVLGAQGGPQTMALRSALLPGVMKQQQADIERQRLVTALGGAKTPPGVDPAAWQQMVQTQPDQAQKLQEAAMLANARPHQNTPEEQFIADARAKGMSVLDAHKQWEKAGWKPESEGAGWQVVNDTNGTPYRYNARTFQATDLSGKPYSPTGFAKISNNSFRTPAAMFMDSWKREHPNAGAQEVSAALADFAGNQAQGRTLGTQGAKVSSAANGLDLVADSSKEAYSKLPRGSFVPFNQLAKMAQTNAFSDPAQADAYAADQAVINLWGKSINPNGVLTVEAQHRGAEMLNQAQSHEAHDKVIDRMKLEGHQSVAGIDKSRNIPNPLNSPAPASLPKMNTPGDAMNLSPGTHFLDANGVERVR